MASDIERKSYDERQRYRGVVAQQGRVTLAADQNEASEIAVEEQRKEALDFVGPYGVPTEGFGTPDDGYVLSPEADQEITVGKGWLYVGGLRVELAEDTPYSEQPDWIDGPEAPPADATRELVYLTLEEHEVSAVEDHALREVALGGPDTTQRTRIRQRIHRRATAEDGCVDAWQEWTATLDAAGQVFDPHSMRLLSLARLAARFTQPDGGENACQPVQQGGYLGSENQAVRLQIGELDGASVLLWAFDNGSALYSALPDESDALALVLNERPVDEHHHPRQGQYVEVLRAASQLPNGEYAAATSGFVVALDADYDPDQKRLTLAAPLPAEYVDPDQTPLLFVKVWEQALAPEPGFLPVGESGLEVELDGDDLVLGDHWIIALRPDTPHALYPARYADPQPPDGPRRWACPLGIVAWSSEDGEVVASCRPPFDNLVELTKRVTDLENRPDGGGCCTLTITPESVGGGTALPGLLPQIAELLKKGAKAIVICFGPGIYELRVPLILGKAFRGVTFKGCADGVIVRAAKGTEANFVLGMAILAGARDITFQHIEFQLPAVSLTDLLELGGVPTKDLPPKALEGLTLALGVRALSCQNLTFESCRFQFPATAVTLGAGIFASGTMVDQRIERCEFLGPGRVAGAKTRGGSVGYLILPAVGLVDSSLPLDKAVSGKVLAAVLDGAEFRNNLFRELAVAAYGHGLFGRVVLEGNRVEACDWGFMFLSTDAVALASQARLSQVKAPSSQASLIAPLFEVLRDPDLARASVIGRGYALGSYADDLPRIEVKQQTPSYDAPAPDASRGFGFLLEAIRSAFGMSSEVSSDAWELDGTPFAQLDRGMTAAESLAMAAKPGEKSPFPLDLHCVNNDIDVSGGRGAALVLWDKHADEPDAALICANRLRSEGGLVPTALCAMVRHAAVTGNLILNESASAERATDRLTQAREWIGTVRRAFSDLASSEPPPKKSKKSAANVPPTDTQTPAPGQVPESRQDAIAKIANLSLVLVPVPIGNSLQNGVAVTGNVFRGQPILPPRSGFPPPFNDWRWLNTEL